ncbi:MAG: hypothetical protein KY475_25380 [Planctomycetes bacterium]|nr:hypothetical protein [Planctomycetota bacterium]
MSLIKSLTHFFSRGGKAESLQRRGMAKAEHEDWPGAIEDYTAAIEFPNAPSEIKAMAFFNRAVAHAHQNAHAKAEEDLMTVLAMPEAPEKVRAAAKEKLARWGKRRGK